MKKTLCIIIMCAVSLAAVSTAGAAFTPIIYAEEDALVDDYYQTGNFGDEIHVATQGKADGMGALPAVQRSYLKFNLAENIPTDAEILSATFGIYLYEIHEGGFNSVDPHVSLHYVDDDTWNEGSITWQKQPSDYEPGYIDEQRLTVDSGYYLWDLFSQSGEFTWSAYADDLDDGYISLLIRSPDEALNNYAHFYSSEYAMENARPFLEIAYIPEPAVVCLLGLGGAVLLRKVRRA